ncbi:MAG: baseplate J/gp47 family protein [Ewingella sp.]|uniref:baseplate J/gp47 family protein n=1 Tax=Ewingella sp. TaxID=1897459 RepID=UPI003F8DE918
MMLNLDTLGLSATVTASGISAPDYQTILSTITSYFQQIYGTDAYIDPDSKDGQMIALYALGIHDANNAMITVYNSFSPATAQGGALSSNVKINGITRQAATKSTADLVITGVPGTLITAGSVRDANGGLWDLPVNANIDVTGTMTVTATCRQNGTVAALAGTINQIATPTRGWYTAINPLAATPGSNAETDLQLRQRQERSTALPSQTTLDGIDGALFEVDGVTRVRIYENDTDVTDGNGLPPHSISCVVGGGDSTAIATVIAKKKDQGTSTFGTTAIGIIGKYGEPKVIRFARPSDVGIFVNISLSVYAGYTSSVGDSIKTEVAKYINSLQIGDDVLVSRIYSPANLGVMSGGDSRYYDINTLSIGRSAETAAASNIPIAYNEAASSDIANISITVT